MTGAIIAGALAIMVALWAFLSALRGLFKRSPPPTAFVPRVAKLKRTGEYRQPIVGESYYQRALRELAGRGEVEHECTARLVMELDNPHDRHAVRVDIAGEKVGYLDRDTALRYHQQLEAVSVGLVTVECGAKVFGGGVGRSLGVWLDLP